MRLFVRYLRYRWRVFALGLLFSGIFTAIFWLYRLPVDAAIYPALLCVAIGMALLALDFARVRRKHEALEQIITADDARTSVLPEPASIQDEDYQKILRLLGEEQAAYRSAAHRGYADMIDYYSVWAHQIKTPIASMALRLQGEDSSLSRALTADLRRIEQYVEMALTFLRLDSQSTDYVIREYDLDEIVRRAVRSFSSEFIARKLSLHYQPLNVRVVTDEKWLGFVLEQLLSNALKYTPSGGIFITLAGEKTLQIRDTGIGIAPEDLPRIFENGYTGYNGRSDRKASGIGLYLCKRICDNLGHAICASSAVDAGTTIEIDLAQLRLEME